MSDLPTPKMETGSLRREMTLVRSLYEMARDIGSVLETKEVLNRAVRNLVETMNVGHASVMLYNWTTNIAELVAEYPLAGGLGTRLSLRASPVVVRFAENPQPLIIPDIDRAQTELGPAQIAAQRLGVKSMLIVPMLAQGKLMGSILIDALGTPREFSPVEIEGVQALSVQLAISIRNAQLFEESERRAQQLEKIANLSRSILSTLDRSAILGIVAAETRQLVHADGISVAIHWPDEPKLYLYLLNDSDEEPPVAEFSFSEAALRFVCNSGESLALDDISSSDYPDYKVLTHHALPDTWATNTLMRAALIVPLRVGGRIIGTYNLTRSEANSFNHADLSVLEQIANQLAVALENARLFSQAASRVQTERLLNQLSGSLDRGDLQSLILNTTRELATSVGAKRARVRLNTLASDPIDAARIKKMLDSRTFAFGKRTTTEKPVTPKSVPDTTPDKESP